MTNTSTSTRHETAPLLTRGLIFLLLTLITFSATVGAVHKHSIALSARDGARAFRNADETATSPIPLLQTGACLICKLQQQLSNCLLHAPSFILSLFTETAPALWLTVFGLFTVHITRRGRAPPLRT